MSTFDYLWKLLNPQGEFIYRERACRRLWDTFDLSKQREIYGRIREKKRRGEFVNDNPYFAIVNNVAEQKPAHGEPTNYNGAQSLPDEPLVRAVYNGVGGIYTRAEAEMYNMQIKGEFKL